jgi:hypothetical protein
MEKERRTRSRSTGPRQGADQNSTRPDAPRRGRGFKMLLLIFTSPVGSNLAVSVEAVLTHARHSDCFIPQDCGLVHPHRKKTVEASTLLAPLRRCNPIALVELPMGMVGVMTDRWPGGAWVAPCLALVGPALTWSKTCQAIHADTAAVSFGSLPFSCKQWGRLGVPSADASYRFTLNGKPESYLGNRQRPRHLASPKDSLADAAIRRMP